MSHLKWSKELETGIDIIDNQHRGLVQIINRLIEGINENKSNAFLAEIFLELYEYSQIHFDTESMLYRKSDYPDADEHDKEHAEFIKKISSFKEILNEEQEQQQVMKELGSLSFLSLEVLSYLSNWFYNHVSERDAKLRQYLIDDMEEDQELF